MSSSIALIRIIAAAAVVVWVRMQRVNFCRSVKTRPHSVNSEQPPPPQPPTMDARGFIVGELTSSQTTTTTTTSITALFKVMLCISF